MPAVQRKLPDSVFKAIADPTRREILTLLRGGKLSVGEIAGNFRVSRPAISKHIRLLRTAGLVVTSQDGASNICGLNAEPLQMVDEWLGDYKTYWRENLRSLKEYAEEQNEHW